jgi:hypothetical protein
MSPYKVGSGRGSDLGSDVGCVDGEFARQIKQACPA